MSQNLYPPNRWLIKIKAPENALDELSKYFENPNSDLKIIKIDDSYFFTSCQLDLLTSIDEANEKAKLIISGIKGISQLLLGWTVPIEYHSIYKSDETGTMKGCFQLGLEFTVRPLIPRVIGFNQKVIKLDPAVFFSQYISIAHKNDRVLYVLRMIDFGFESWWALYCILDAIKNDMGGYRRIKWMNQKERKRFTATVQDQRIIGLNARHGYGYVKNNNQISDPMTLAEAQDFIWRTVILWLNEKIQHFNVNLFI